MSLAQVGDQLVHLVSFGAAGRELAHPGEPTGRGAVGAGVGVLEIGEHHPGVDRQDRQRINLLVALGQLLPETPSRGSRFTVGSTVARIR